MRIERHPYNYPIEELFPQMELFGDSESGGIWVAEQDNLLYIITDGRTIASYAEIEKNPKYLDTLIAIYEFDTEEERRQYIEAKGWKKNNWGYKIT